MTTKKQFVALARVSSREQEREGFSLDVQEDALRAFAERNGGEIIMLWRIAETASKTDERTTFKEMVRYVRRHAAGLDGILFYKIDRAARNLPDYVKLEELETKHNVPFISISQPTENTPAGRMMRRTLANMAAFFTEQQSLDVRAGQARRVESGLFMGKAPFGYRNVRVEKRGLVEIDPENGPKVKRIFHLYAHHNHTLDSLLVALRDEGITYTTAAPQFGRSKLYEILRDRSYIGEIDYQGQWRPGKHPPLIDRATWDRVQVLLGEKTRRSHELTYAGELIGCGHCGRPITGERVTKKAKGGEREYVYYRCAGYLAEGHPRVRVREAHLDAEVLALFDRLKVADPEVRDWFVAVLRAKTKDEQVASREKADELQRQLSQVRGQQDRLVNLRLADEIDADTYAKKNTELRDRVATLELIDKYADHPELALERRALSVLSTEESADLKQYMDEVVDRPSGATRSMPPSLREEKRRLEELLDVDLSHVSDEILDFVLFKEPLREKVKERLRSSPPVDEDRTIRHCIDCYVRVLRQSEGKKLLKPSTIDFHKHGLNRFASVVGPTRSVEQIDHDIWHEFGEHCESYGGGEWEPKTADSTLKTTKAFVRWLFKSERIESLPRNFDDYRVSVPTKEPTVFTPAELRKILGHADDELRLMVLLALNTGANQIDIAQLEYAKSEKGVGLWRDQIRRKRVKTRRHERVPVVKYKLWPETQELLDRFKTEGPVVLRNGEGGLWVARVRGEDDKLKNNDALGLRFTRFLTKIGLKRPGYSFKTLRATAASLLGNSEYRPFGPLFLGQAPDGVFEKHYMQEDCRMLGEAVAWLRSQILSPVPTDTAGSNPG